MSRFFQFFLFFLTVSLSAQTIDFDRPEKVGTERTAQLRLKLSREYLFQIPGAGKPIRKLETIDLVLLTDIKIVKVNQKKQPIELLLTPRILGGALNGRRIDPNLMKGLVIRANLEKYPCTFTGEDGKQVPKEAVTILSALFRQQQDITYSDILGAPRAYKEGAKWKPETGLILKNLADRNLSFNKKNLSALVTFENKFRVGKIPCVAVLLNLSSINSHAYDFQVKTRLILPVKKSDGGAVRVAREGVEVVDRKTITGDFIGSGSAVRITTKEQLEVTYAQK